MPTCNGSPWKGRTNILHQKRGRPEADLPHIRFHDLRHTATTILLSMEVHPKVVQEILGHSTINMTMDSIPMYLPSMQKEAMDRWNDEFGTHLRRLSTATTVKIIVKWGVYQMQDG